MPGTCQGGGLLNTGFAACSAKKKIPELQEALRRLAALKDSVAEEVRVGNLQEWQTCVEKLLRTATFAKAWKKDLPEGPTWEVARKAGTAAVARQLKSAYNAACKDDRCC